MENYFQQDLYSSLPEEQSPPPFYPLKPPRRSAKYWGRKALIVGGALLILTGIFFAYKIFSAGDKIFSSKEGNSLFTQIKRLILSEDKDKAIAQTERINILLIGIRGTGHYKDQGGGPFLADTIIVLSVKPQSKELAILSIPRDLWVDIPGFSTAKINTAYAYGIKQDFQEGGARLLSETVEKVTGLPISYYVIVDFAGFEKAIDIVGGIDIVVDKSFTDYFYPTWNYEYQTIAFEAGRQHLDGDKALKFVRSRHGTNGEDSDFARARRQQKVLLAVKDKAFSLSTILNPFRISALVDSFGNHLLTNLELSEAKELIQIAREAKADKIVNRVLENSSEGLLVASVSDNGASILVPRKGSFSEIQALAQNIFDPNYKIGSAEATAPPPEKEKIKVRVYNGTAINGLAGKTAVELKEAGYEIVGISNASKQDYEKTVIYDYTEGYAEEALRDLKERLQANVMAGTEIPPEQFPSKNSEDADFAVVLGRDQKL